MVMMMKFFLARAVCNLFFPKLKKTRINIPLMVLLKAGVVQKIFRINKNVPWPVHWTSKVMCPEKIIRGSRYPGMSASCHIDGRNGIEFGNNVWIGPRVSIISMNHNVNDYYEYEETKPIRIKDNCWLGANVVILSGVELGNHTIVAAGAIVTKSFPKGNQIIGGNPAKVIKELSPYNIKTFNSH